MNPYTIQVLAEDRIRVLHAEAAQRRRAQAAAPPNAFRGTSVLTAWATLRTTATGWVTGTVKADAVCCAA